VKSRTNCNTLLQVAAGFAATITLAICLLLAPAAEAQPKAASRTTFAAASVKPNTDSDMSRFAPPTFLGDRYVVTNCPLLLIIASAYRLPFQSSRLSGGPDWIRSERYDIEATVEQGAIPRNALSMVREDQMRLMLQALLAERFHMVVRRETKELPVYAVTVSKGGPKLEKAGIEEKDCADGVSGTGIVCHNFMGGRGRGLHGKAVDMSDLALFVSNWTDRPVLDETGIQGLYHIETRGWANMTPGPAPPEGAKAEDGSDAATLPTVFTIFNELGLRLEAKKGPVEMFVIEHVEKPTAN
jgi:uncharacterized protein (TIGR03435 family)